MTSLIGRKLGIYEIRDVIGHGGMASVYLGYRADVDRQVAIKVLPPHPGLDADVTQRFQLEARTIANLQHPHILPLYDYGATDEGVLYLVMPYVRGGTLDQLLRDGKLPVERTARIVREISGALDYAHRQGVIHRDIKPANILIDGEGNALLADFGIAKLSDTESRLTGTSVVGTPAYMSPEQAQGGEITSRTDMYSFGVVVFEMLTGKLPYTGDTPVSLMLKHITEPVPDVSSVGPGLPRALDAVMQRQIAKKPDERYATAAVFGAAFQDALSRPDTVDSPTPTPAPQPARSNLAATVNIKQQPETIVIPPPPQRESNNTAFVIAGVAVLLAVFALIVALAASNPAPPQTTGTEPTASTGPAVTPTLIVRESVPSVGRASFSTSSASLMGDSFSLSIQGIPPAPQGSVYVVALIDTATGEHLPLGRLNVDAVGDGALSYTDPAERFLPGIYNALIIAAEADPAAPTYADVRYSAALPRQMTTVMQEIFVTSPSGFRERGLLESAELEARFANQHAGLAAGARNIGARRTHNEHTLNILLGGLQDFDGNGRSANPGTGIGLLPLIDMIDDSISTVADTPEAPVSTQIEAELVRVCLQNLRMWINEVITYEQAMLLADTLEESEGDAQQSSLITQRLQPGIDENENGIVEPFEGECGLEQIGTFGLVIASFDIVEGPLTETPQDGE